MKPPVLSESEPQATDEVSTAASEMERERVFSGIYFHDNRPDKTFKKMYTIYLLISTSISLVENSAV